MILRRNYMEIRSESLEKALDELRHLEKMKRVLYQRGEKEMFYDYCNMADGARRVLSALGIAVKA